MTRKHRLAVGLARQMVGLPAPSGKSSTGSATSSRASSPHGLREKAESHLARKEEEIAIREAESIVRRGEAEAQVAGQGGYSEEPYDRLDKSGSGSTTPSRSNSPNALRGNENLRSSSQGRPLAQDDDVGISQTPKRSSWSNLSQISSTEQATANAHLMTRLKPFLANPLTSIPISAFFYSDSKSRQKTVDTNSSGHFSFRAALDFVPTHVRILASENLSATEEVQITEPQGISVVSDVDDTIKHSAISSGAREMFKNVFIRDLGELGIQGVEGWYHRLFKMGVTFHYVSNSPWQLYPLLTDFFSAVNLPPGSFHLKQYTGMFQGIFEPVAERKKTTLDKIMTDFPERRFLLIGDSGEADLEVYTDVVLENPGRILGIFIRDVTTPVKKGFFDSSMGPSSSENVSSKSSKSDLRGNKSSSSLSSFQRPDKDAVLTEAKKRSLRDFEKTTSSATET